MRFDLEDGSKAVADIDGTGVLARTLQHTRAGGGQRLQMHARALVAAVLGPHHREDAELGDGRLPAERFDDALVFVWGESVPREDLVSDGHRAVAKTPRSTALDRKSTRLNSSHSQISY